jgi:hypothetical protein
MSPLDGNTGNLPSPGSKGIRGGGMNRFPGGVDGFRGTGLLVMAILV